METFADGVFVGAFGALVFMGVIIIAYHCGRDSELNDQNDRK